jgi:hypothetical protein
MPSLVPGIHDFEASQKEDVDGRDTPGTKVPGGGHGDVVGLSQ